MTRLSVGFHPSAVEDATAAEAWYRERSDTAALAFASELDHAIERILESPERWARHTLGTRRFVLRRFPFTVIYRVTSIDIEVVAVSHGRRRPHYWRNR